MVIGVLADTQGLLTPAQISSLKKAFKGVDTILHAGPVGDLRVLEQLGNIAPTKGVCGNAEDFIVRSELFIRQAWKLKGVSIGLMHGYGKPQGLKSFLLRQFEESPVDVIVYGSNFEPYARKLGPTYFFNPGSFSGVFRKVPRGEVLPEWDYCLSAAKKWMGKPGFPSPLDADRQDRYNEGVLRRNSFEVLNGSIDGFSGE